MSLCASIIVRVPVRVAVMITVMNGWQEYVFVAIKPRADKS